MRKEITFDHPNKMHFESAHKTINEQTVCIDVGNVMAPTQYSTYIRTFDDIGTWKDHPAEPGHLQHYDLSYFLEIGVPQWMINKVRVFTHERGGILYLFKHYNGQERILDGLVLTDTTYHHVETWYLNHNWKAMDAVDKAKEYIVEMPEPVEVSEGA